MKPPDLRDPAARNRLNELVYRLETTDYSIGRVSTNFWLWEYQRFLNDFPEVDYARDFYKRVYLRQFFAQFDYQQFRGMVRINDSAPNGEPCISAFTFQTSFYGTCLPPLFCLTLFIENAACVDKTFSIAQ